MKPVEKAIYEMNYYNDKNNKFKEMYKKENLSLITIPFENFVLQPKKFIQSFEIFLSTSISDKTSKIMKKQNIPRKKISEGIPLDIYKRCGWTPSDKNLSENEELEKRREYAVIQGAGREYLDILDKLSEEYEKKYLNGII